MMLNAVKYFSGRGESTAEVAKFRDVRPMHRAMRENIFFSARRFVYENRHPVL
jgi:hypothetical protein